MSNGFLISQSNRIRSTPFSSRNELAGVKNYTVYNNTLLPTIFKSCGTCEKLPNVTNE